MNEQDNQPIDEQADISTSAQDNRPLQDSGAAGVHESASELLGIIEYAATEGTAVMEYAHELTRAADDEEANRCTVYVYDRKDEMTDIYHYRRAGVDDELTAAVCTIGPGAPGDILLEHERLK